MRTTRDNNEMPQTLLQPFTLSAIIDLICSLRIIGNPAFQNFLSSEKNSFEIFFAEISNIALLIRQEILQSHPFLMSRKFERQGCQWYEVKRIKTIFAVKEKIWGTSIISSSSHFCNETDFEQYLFNGKSEPRK